MKCNKYILIAFLISLIFNWIIPKPIEKECTSSGYEYFINELPILILFCIQITLLVLLIWSIDYGNNKTV